MISIITPIYNFDKNQFKLSLDSIIKQTSKEFEWVIAIDGGQIAGDTVYTIQESGIKYKVVHTPENYGASVARNLAFQISDGDIITYLDCGDELEPSRVSDIEQSFEDTQWGFSMSDYKLKYPNGHETMYSPGTLFSGNNLLPYVNKQNIIIPLGVAHTRKLFVEAGGFQRGIVCGEDGILWRRMLETLPRVTFIHRIAGTYHISETGQSRTQRRPDMGGFAFDAKDPGGSHGQYLDESWFETYNSVQWFDRKE